jgi:MFS family permease
VTSRGSFLADLRVVMRGRDFRRLFATRLVSQASDGAFQGGLASVFFFNPERATTAAGAAAALSAAVLPYTLVGPFAGVLLDRWRRRQVLVIANMVRSLLVLVVALLVIRGTGGLTLYAGVLACLSVNRFFLAGLGASLPHVVPRHELVMANAVSPTSGTIAAILGAGAAYLLHRGAGSGSAADAVVLVVAAVGYLTSALVATRMARDLLGPAPHEVASWGSVRAAAVDVAGGLVDAARHVRERRRAAYALAAIGAHRLAYGVSTIATILLSRNRFNDPADVDAGLALLAAVFVASGLGFLVAAIVTPVMARRWGTSGTIVVSFAAAAAAEYAFVAGITAVMLMVGAFVLGIAAQSAKICVDAIVQDAVDDEFRGRVFSFYDVVFNAAFVAAAAGSALVLPADGYAPVVYGLIATVYAGAAFAYRLASRARAQGDGVASG